MANAAKEVKPLDLDGGSSLSETCAALTDNDIDAMDSPFPYIIFSVK